MKIVIRYMAQLKQAAGLAQEMTEVTTGCRPREAVIETARRHGDPLRSLVLDANGQLQATILVFVGEEQVGPDDPVTLEEGDVVTVLSPVAGG